MEISVQKSNQLKAVAVLMMLFLHLFNRPFKGLFQPLLFIGTQSLSYYISLFCDACVPIFCFLSGYGLYFKFVKNTNAIYKQENSDRIKKLYINYWIILLLFAVLLGWLMNADGLPGDLTKFVLNVTAIDTSYNSAWWFFFTYLLLVASSAYLFYIIDRFPLLFLSATLLIIYVIGFYYRVYQPGAFDNFVLNWFQRQLSLYATSLLSFCSGAMALKYKWNTKMSFFFATLKFKNALILVAIAVLIVIHGVIPNFIVAPFLAIPFIFLFCQLNLSKNVAQIFDYVAPHATNMWLVHMFFYVVYFESFIYSATYVLPIFFVLVSCSLFSSIIVNLLNNAILKKNKLK
ncbi:acyltransferase [Flavobacterium sp. K77]|uniref:acyltransferase family protein n=1 Tax=Flavobacterium sp. K77 TaxID=2910676 RepID=UPI001F3F6EDE|nr:acyltransferase family protein [Flavobacterium sp. K77]MCF6142087.1 acyltransferase [Flavobacterium sp. K77]